MSPRPLICPAQLEDWEAFDVFRLAELTGGRPLQAVSLGLLRRRGLLARLCLPEERVRSFLADVEEAYHPHNPYHNSSHAADVTQVGGAAAPARALLACACCGGRRGGAARQRALLARACCASWVAGAGPRPAKQHPRCGGAAAAALGGLQQRQRHGHAPFARPGSCQAHAGRCAIRRPAFHAAPAVLQALGAMLAADDFASHLSDLEQLAVIVAAAIHDVGHPGVNNDFLIRTQSEVGGVCLVRRGGGCRRARLRPPCGAADLLLVLSAASPAPVPIPPCSHAPGRQACRACQVWHGECACEAYSGRLLRPSGTLPTIVAVQLWHVCPPSPPQAAVAYNDQSINENMHAAAGFKLLAKKENNFLSRWAATWQGLWGRGSLRACC